MARTDQGEERPRHRPQDGVSVPLPYVGIFHHCLVVVQSKFPGPEKEILRCHIAEFVKGKHQQIPERKQYRQAE